MPTVGVNYKGLVTIIYDGLEGKPYYGVSPSRDAPLKGKDGERKPKRPCCRCGKDFQPTVKRRLLCSQCFDYANGENAPEDE